MIRKLLLVDLENKHKVDLSPLDESFRAIIFVGAKQSPPKASTKPDSSSCRPRTTTKRRSRRTRRTFPTRARSRRHRER